MEESSMYPSREVFTLRWQIQLNQCHLNDVRDARAALDREWSELQAERQRLIGELALLEAQDGDD